MDNFGMLEALLTSIIGIAVVFAVLIVLSFLVKLISYVSIAIDKNSKKANTLQTVKEDIQNNNSNQLILDGVDEPTAAILMAIVADKLGVEPEKLIFKSMKAI